MIGVAAAAALAGAAYAEPAAADPTRPTAEMADRMKVRMADAASLRILALVAGADGEGVALVGETPQSAAAVRKGSVVSRELDGVKVDVRIRSVSPRGVEIAADSLSEPLFVRGGYTPLDPPENPPPGDRWPFIVM